MESWRDSDNEVLVRENLPPSPFQPDFDEDLEDEPKVDLKEDL